MDMRSLLNQLRCCPETKGKWAGLLTDLDDSSDPEDRVSRLLRLLELRCDEDDGESSM